MWRAANGIDPEGPPTHRRSTTAERFRPSGNTTSTEMLPLQRPPAHSADAEPRAPGGLRGEIAGTKITQRVPQPPAARTAGRPRRPITHAPSRGSDRGAGKWITRRGHDRPSVLELRAATNLPNMLSIRSRARLHRAGPAGRHLGPATTDPTDRTPKDVVPIFNFGPPTPPHPPPPHHLPSPPSSPDTLDPPYPPPLSAAPLSSPTHPPNRLSPPLSPPRCPHRRR